MENNMEVQDFINSVAVGNAAEAKETLNDLLSARAFDALESKKIEIAKNLFGNGEQEETTETVTDTEEETAE